MAISNNNVFKNQNIDRNFSPNLAVSAIKTNMKYALKLIHFEEG